VPGPLLSELTSRECNHYLVEGGDIAVLPVGSAEVVGPHLPVGAWYFAAEAFATLLAEGVDGLRLPLTPFSIAPAVYDRPGSVAVEHVPFTAYVRAAMDDLLAAGFCRILLVTHADYVGYYTPQEFYEDHGVAAAGLNLREAWSQALRARGVGEDSALAGALRVLGKGALLEKVMAENARLLKEGWQPTPLPDGLAHVLRQGVAGFRYPPGGFPVPPNPDLNPVAGEEALRAAVAALVPSVASLRTYNEFLAKRHASRGLMWRGWRWTE